MSNTNRLVHTTSRRQSFSMTLKCFHERNYFQSSVTEVPLTASTVGRTSLILAVAQNTIVSQRQLLGESELFNRGSQPLLVVL